MSIKEEFEEAAISEIMESIAPRIGKWIGPVRKKLFDFLSKNKKCLHIKIIEDELYLLIIDEPKINSFDVEEDGYKAISIDEFVPILETGDFSAIL